MPAEPDAAPESAVARDQDQRRDRAAGEHQQREPAPVPGGDRLDPARNLERLQRPARRHPAAHRPQQLERAFAASEQARAQGQAGEAADQAEPYRGRNEDLPEDTEAERIHGASNAAGFQSCLAPETFTTFAHLTISARRNLSNWSIVMPIGPAPCFAHP